ncbi:MAG: DUF4388 domain-containing protein [Candidatus Obscuribacterales bacterium]|nr:DUF4388 domain-containing protein [Candidatus Obscuribacterales bacterium]
MSMVLDRTAQALADATGFIVDRTVFPEKIIGQAWLISKSRVAVKASSVSLYSDAPWALSIRFPHPDLNFSVKAMSLHPEFNKRLVRDHYLDQINNSQKHIYDNDIGTLTLDPEAYELVAERVQELHRALSLPLSVSPADLSGVMRPGEFGNVLQNTLSSGRSGLLNLYDERKLPFAHLEIRSGTIVRASFNSLTNEYAVCELIWQKQGGNFVLHTQDSFKWGATQEITTPTDQLAAEAMRRHQEIVKALESLGGPEARYAKLRQDVDFGQLSPQVRWGVEKVWQVLNEFLPVSKLASRAGIDTYTSLQALLALRGLSAIEISTKDPFHRSGQLGQILTPGYDVDLNVWDKISGFCLEEHSAAPLIMNGNYVGPSSLLAARTLLHNLPLSDNGMGAALIKDGRLIGIHGGRYVANQNNQLPFELWQMAWIGSLSDMNVKRLRMGSDLSAEPVATADFDPQKQSGSLPLTGMRARSASELDSEIMPSEVRPVINNPGEPPFLSRFSKMQIFIFAACMFAFGFLMFVNSLFGGSRTPAPTVVKQAANIPQEQSLSSDAKAAVKIATSVGQFKDTIFSPYQFVNTSALTQPKESFGLESERQNQKILCVLWPNYSAADTIKSVQEQLPFLNYVRNKESEASGDSGQAERLTWTVGHYKNKNKEDKDVTVLIGAYESSKPEHCILVLAQPYTEEGMLDYHVTLSVMQRMFAERKMPVPSEEPAPPPVVAPEAAPVDSVPEPPKE